MLLCSNPPVHLFVADMEGLVAYAALTFHYALWHGLFVAQPCRGLKIGGSLLTKVVQSAHEAEAIWLEWQTPRWNTAATNFYLRNGAENWRKSASACPSERLHCPLSGRWLSENAERRTNDRFGEAASRHGNQVPRSAMGR
ncbi:GNAT family N-acetyltransferase [Tropicimonas sp. IMCC34011]|uniref:GNAT family N-acetyltransferase n=1 Tax=Tropicimonas sp. IMCC34011 TaxID=2248759 RepID=UPI000E23962D|nr:GNAT family N-acetyltransferase [Tropicimonas sp. IMCC34011]